MGSNRVSITRHMTKIIYIRQKKERKKMRIAAAASHAFFSVFLIIAPSPKHFPITHMLSFVFLLSPGNLTFLLLLLVKANQYSSFRDNKVCTVLLRRIKERIQQKGVETGVKSCSFFLPEIVYEHSQPQVLGKDQIGSCTSTCC